MNRADEQNRGTPGTFVGASPSPESKPPERHAIIRPISDRRGSRIGRLDDAASPAADDVAPPAPIARHPHQETTGVVARQPRSGEHDPRWLKVFIAVSALLAIGFLWLQGQTPEGDPPTPAAQSPLGAVTAESIRPSATAIPSATPETAPTLDRPATQNAPGAGAPATPPASDASASPSADNPTATVEPATATPVPTLIERIAEAEANLRSGRLEAVIDFGNGSRSTASIEFDLAGADGLARLRSITTYQGLSQARVAELVIVGQQSWRRVDGGPWTTASNQDSVWGNVRTFLPSAHALPDAPPPDDGQQPVLTWHDPSRDSDVTLEVDPATGVPIRLTRVARQSMTVLTIAYLDWNSTIEINPPEGG